jgi:spore coat protein A
LVAAAAALGVLLGPPAALRADVVTIVASKDATLYQDDFGQFANGAGEYMFTGVNGGGAIRRAVVAFDLASAIPPGSVVNSVTITMFLSRTRTGTFTASFHRVTADWGEGTSNAGGEEGGGAPSTPGDATWIHRSYNTVLWTTPGGDFVPTASASRSVGSTGSYIWSSTAALVADVQSFVDNPASNFGWILLCNETVNSTKRFDSRTSLTPSRRPTITVNFTPPPGTGACCFDTSPCRPRTQTDCETQGGVFQGVGTSCTPSPCPPATGACCFGNTTCSVLTQAGCASQGGTYQGDYTPCSPGLCPLVLTPFVDPLPRPAVMQPDTGTAGGAATYTATVTEFQQQLHRDLPPTTVWGINGGYPGPTIEAGCGQPVSVTWVNNLRDLTTGQLRTQHYLPVDLCLDGPDEYGAAARTVFHLHGGVVPHDFDGYPEYTQLPGQQVTYDYPNLQPPATLWYHDHSQGITRLNVYMGLAGFYLLRDPFEQSLGLPAGEYEVPLAIQDRMFNADGTLMYHDEWHDHFFGDTILVNGKVWPYLTVKRGKYRFRLLNGSTSRTYTLALSNSQFFQQIGTEQGLLSAPVQVSSVTLTPGERADIVMDFSVYSAGSQVTLVNSAPAPFPGQPDEGVIPNVMRFVVESATGHTAPLPASLRPVQAIPEALAVRTRDMVLRQLPDDICGGTAWFINGLRWHDVVDMPRLETVEIWRFINRSAVSHPMHPHLVKFLVLDRQVFDVGSNDEVVPVGPRFPPQAGEAGWKDTVDAPPNMITRVIMRFEGYTGHFPFHCHILEHEDNEMMRQFEAMPACTGDYNADLTLTSQDYFHFLADFFPRRPRSDVNRDGRIDSQDFFDFLASFFSGCP